MTDYYLICDSALVKRERVRGSLTGNDFRFHQGKWEPISENEINDRLMGYDPTEDTPLYGIGNMDIMNEIRSITEKEAMEYIKEAQGKDL